MNSESSLLSKKNSTSDFASFSDALSIPIILLNKDLIVYINRCAFNLLGIGTDSKYISKLDDLFSLDNHQNIVALKNYSAFANEENKSGQLEVKLYSGCGTGTYITGKFKFVHFDEQNFVLLELENNGAELIKVRSLSLTDSSLFRNSTIPFSIITGDLVIKEFNSAFESFFAEAATNNIDENFLRNFLPASAKAE